MTFESMITDYATTTIISTSTNGNKHTLQDKIEDLMKDLRINPKHTGSKSSSVINN